MDNIWNYLNLNYSFKNELKKKPIYAIFKKDKKKSSKIFSK